jgi:hypothetical protein
MNIYLDTEFDGHGGELISLALAAEDGTHWYGIFSAYCGDEWVAEHVAPKLYAMPPTISGAPEALWLSLEKYLSRPFNRTIWADWPDDFAHLMRLMSGPSYAYSFVIPCTMQLIVTPDGEPKPEFPHNALSDALALMHWHQESGT